jgi:hypothetical protein
MVFLWNPDDTAADATARAERYATDDPLAAARGCVFGVLFSLPIWAALAAIGYALAGIRFP